MSSKRDTIVPDVDNLPRDDLLDLYEKLAESYRRLKAENEEIKQEVHHHKQQTRILKRSQIDLQSELDGINEVHKQELEVITKANSSTIEGLKTVKQEIESDKLLLESKLDDLSSKLSEQEKENEELRIKIIKQPTKPRISDSFSLNLEVEIESLQRELIEIQQKLDTSELKSHEKDLEIEELHERMLCLEDNLDSKKTEVEEKNEALEGLQEQLHEMTVEIAMLKSAPDDASKLKNIKTQGNS
jgi:chromosome segregation ATPase